MRRSAPSAELMVAVIADFGAPEVCAREETARDFERAVGRMGPAEIRVGELTMPRPRRMRHLQAGRIARHVVAPTQIRDREYMTALKGPISGERKLQQALIDLINGPHEEALRHECAGLLAEDTPSVDAASIPLVVTACEATFCGPGSGEFDLCARIMALVIQSVLDERRDADDIAHKALELQLVVMGLHEPAIMEMALDPTRREQLIEECYVVRRAAQFWEQPPAALADAALPLLRRAVAASDGHLVRTAYHLSLHLQRWLDSPRELVPSRRYAERLIAAADRQAATRLDAFLHDPAFIRLETPWRGVQRIAWGDSSLDERPKDIAPLDLWVASSPASSPATGPSAVERLHSAAEAWDGRPLIVVVAAELDDTQHQRLRAHAEERGNMRVLGPKVQSGRRAARCKGWLPSRLPYGYGPDKTRVRAFDYEETPFPLLTTSAYAVARELAMHWLEHRSWPDELEPWVADTEARLGALA